MSYENGFAKAEPKKKKIEKTPIYLVFVVFSKQLIEC